MKRYLWGFVALAICLSLVAGMLPSAMAATGDEIRAARRIISVVFDDSGSMTEERWTYASYALQALTAQLNEQDLLYITYMSDNDVADSQVGQYAEKIRKNPVNLQDIPAAVKKLSKWDGGKGVGTPFSSVKVAQAVLEGVESDDLTDQFWLVILTDGGFGGTSDINAELNSRKNKPMKNQTGMNVVYLGMCIDPNDVLDQDKIVKADTRNGLYAYYASDAKEIATAMGEISNLISGRLQATDVKQVDDRTVSFSSKLPVYSISVLAQNTTASVTGAVSQEETLHVLRNVGLNGYRPSVNNRHVLGNAAVINKRDASGSSQVISAGTYTITFSEPVDISQMVIQYEPAIGIKPIITRDGITITDMTALAPEDKVTIEIIPVIPGTDIPIDPKTLPDGIQWRIEYAVDGQIVDSGDGTKLTGVSMKAGDNIIRGIMQIPGFAPSVYEIPFHLEVHIYQLGIQVDQPDPLTYLRKTAGEGSEQGTHVKFTVTDAGEPMDKAAQAEAKTGLKILDITCDNTNVTGFLNRFGKALAQCRLEQNDDGSYSLHPRGPLPFTAFLMMAGEYTVTVGLENDETVTAVGTFTMNPHPGDWDGLGAFLLCILGLLYLLYILFIKYKFRGQTVYYEVFRLRNQRGVEDGSQAESKNLSFISGGLLLPTRACRVKLYGLVLEAGPGGTITVLGKSIARQVYSYKQTTMNPTTSLGAIASSMKKTERKVGKDTEKVADDVVLSPTSPVYFRSDEGDNEIWRIYTSQ